MGFHSRHLSRLPSHLTSHHSLSQTYLQTCTLLPGGLNGCLSLLSHTFHLQHIKSSGYINADSLSKDPLPPKQRSLSPQYIEDKQQTDDRETLILRHSSVIHLEHTIAWEDSDKTLVRQLPHTGPKCIFSH